VFISTRQKFVHGRIELLGRLIGPATDAATFAAIATWK
jgi:hypothetical protein